MIIKSVSFEETNTKYLEDVTNVLCLLEETCKKYSKRDMDTLLNEYHDSIVGMNLGFELTNIRKNGFDCRDDKGNFLESKTASFDNKNWKATFNDTTEEKAESFKSSNVFVSLSVWLGVKTPLCVAVGNNPKIGDYLLERVKSHKENKTVRSTQSIPFSTLLFKYGFKIVVLGGHSKEKVLDILKNKNSSFKNLSIDNILYPEEWIEIKNRI